MWCDLMEEESESKINKTGRGARTKRNFERVTQKKVKEGEKQIK